MGQYKTSVIYLSLSYKHTHTQTNNIRRVVTFPLSELDSSTAGPAAHAPLAPWTPVTIHMLRDGSLTNTLTCPAPLTHTHTHRLLRSTGITIHYNLLPHRYTWKHSEWVSVTVLPCLLHILFHPEEDPVWFYRMFPPLLNTTGQHTSSAATHTHKYKRNSQDWNMSISCGKFQKHKNRIISHLCAVSRIT